MGVAACRLFLPVVCNPVADGVINHEKKDALKDMQFWSLAEAAVKSSFLIGAKFLISPYLSGLKKEEGKVNLAQILSLPKTPFAPFAKNTVFPVKFTLLERCGKIAPQHRFRSSARKAEVVKMEEQFTFYNCSVALCR